MTKDISTTEQRPYHHGDLHRAIVEAALDVLSESQSTEFSLRELARRAGVSHNAPYKHFADKRELLAAVSAVGFELLAKRMAEATKELDSPRERLAAMARAYVCGGVNNPALYRLMFGGYLAGQDDGRPAIERTAAYNMKALIVDAISDGALGRPIADTEANTRMFDGAILVFWSQMHGLTLLLADRLVGPSDKMEELTKSVLQGMLDGLANCIPAIPSGVWVGPPLAE
ncbi:TetR/AcrR family transcriptional regulator [Rhizobium ruizarguesonis]|jgi:AcrR family transcriptional regulator|uniref:TetR/AcrR family transcriptional regulator n=1 Tax=Rhizobium ruizarguesonis TaxID=2081791 RepID=UPI001031E743|nr:TetR/AcrR family transcriptional regulator [Rhizobium ruizarguesonis]TCA14169.1 TetR/AcrR family transcriptional regulator [Rhizobium leguminosarum bv. viciae]NEI31858.1 TetR family transcriptional regulator [Rhizobium ruizarguesonis]TAY92758.1 TetR/AcrR family transcriptional regulator [Rhizobium ruizarguesonis]TAZ77532.1 TetR/AcrR family transcriptional regulator [Rhizobium ruizarguesonis]TBA03907.1 TetR/AcrR family transcriptional regulator [Rhizobium ruizarguesonis]